MNDKRDTQQQKVIRAGTISFDGSGIDCLVRNMSVGGANLEVESQIGIPGSFDLVIDSSTAINTVTSFGGRHAGSALHLIRACPPPNGQAGPTALGCCGCHGLAFKSAVASTQTSTQLVCPVPKTLGKKSRNCAAT
jgi:hypothetical protein